ncbi:O-antigen ligase family protein [Vibrio zhugei]|uniref:O-antigen ligase family protein n=1 Tax=Vibrio zhugei TaxID=2479546 RepID=A0ABV7CBW2_9VIBR|nr:O-antigen ligase family protein [Vibrio zhugei]
MNTFSTVFLGQRYRAIMLFAIFGYVSCAIAFEHLSDAFRAIFILGSVGILYVHRSRIYRDPVIITLALALIVSVLSWCNSLFYIPDSARAIPELDKLARLFLFVFIAYWLKGEKKLIYILFFCFIVSFILGICIKSNFMHSFEMGIFHDKRVDFNIKNAQYTSMFSGLCLIISMFALIQIKYYIKGYTNNLLKYSAPALMCLTMAFFAIMVVITQSRMVFVGLLMVMGLFPLLYKVTYTHTKVATVILFYISAFLAASIALYASLPFIMQRFSPKDIQSLQDIMHLDTSHIPMSSIGIRLNSWIEAIPWIQRHPLLGVGVHGPGLVISQSQVFSERINENFATIKGLRHLHSFHMDTLVSYGLFGFIVLNSIYITVTRQLFKLRSTLPNAENWLMLALCFAIYWFSINFFESFNYRTYGVFAHNVILGGLYSFVLTKRLFDNDNQRKALT